MSITASLVKELREITGVGMMECKKVLVETNGDLQAAQDLLRTRGQAKAEKKAGRIAAEGVLVFAISDSAATLVEVNSETDFAARDAGFSAYAQKAADLILANKPVDVDALAELDVDGKSFAEVRSELVSKIGENVNVRRFELMAPQGVVGSYIHGDRIGVIVDVVGGDEELARDIAMHVAASAPVCVSEDDVPAADLERERKILTEQALNEGKPAEIVEKMIAGRLRKHLAQITLVGQAFVKDPDVTVGKLLKDKGASVVSFVRFEVGEGI
ncbi:MAG: translation elongation factor Ts, partial [Gammaproteobacteria bacterium]|nr:translation elongation factor Ts [Gammaproteobacteria bacterium]